jgi:hypothetical protein
MTTPLIENNRSARERLAALVGRLSDADLARRLESGWSVAATLAHVAFWDLRAAILIDRWAREGLVPSPVDDDSLNDGMRPLLSAIPGRRAAELALEAAQEVDRKIEAAPPELVEAIGASGSDIDAARFEHRLEHVAEIERALAEGGS